MVIKKMSASFGTLSGSTLELHDGLNIIEAPNEYGKSTWCAFLKAMLFGLDTGARDAKGVLADKNKYRPFSGKNMEGSLLVESGGRDIMIERTGSVRFPMGKTSAYYCDSGSPLNIGSADLGGLLTGVSRSVFERSAFISGRTMQISSIPELEKKILSAATTGDEAFSVTEADKRLKTWLRKRNFRQTGEIQVLEARLQKVNSQMTESAKLGYKAGEYRVALEAREREIAKLKDELEAHRLIALVIKAERARKAIEAAESADRYYREAFDRYTGLGSPTEDSVREKREKLASLRALYNAQKSKCEEAQTRVSELTASVNEHSDTGSGNPRLMAVWIFIMVSMALIGVAGVLRNALFLSVPAALVFISATILLIRTLKKRREVLNERSLRKIAEDRLSEATRELSESSAHLEEIEAEMAPLNENDIGEAERAINELSAAKVKLEAAREFAGVFEMPKNIIKPAQIPTHSEQEAQRLLAEAEKEASEQRSAYDMLLGRQQSYPDPVSLQTEYVGLRRRISELSAQCAAIELASKTILEAGEEMRARFSPALSQLTGKYLSRITGGKYASAAVDAAFDACVTAEGDVVSHSASYLSAGTLEQLYLSLRLAISSMVLNDSCPLILDDAFVTFDDERLERALQLIGEIAETRQVILFTCQSREAALAPDKSRIIRHNAG